MDALIVNDDVIRQEDPVLITDGAPNCDPDFEGAELFDNYNPQAWIEIDDARAEGVFTMVVGLGIEMQAAFQQGDIEPDVDPWSTLNELALAGGMVGVDDDPKFKAAYTHAGLLKELALVDDLTFCVGRLPPALAELTVDEFDASVEVTIDGVVFPPISDCGTDDGYTVRQSDDGATIVACGAACALMKVGAHMHFSAECI